MLGGAKLLGMNGFGTARLFDNVVIQLMRTSLWLVAVARSRASQRHNVGTGVPPRLVRCAQPLQETEPFGQLFCLFVFYVLQVYHLIFLVQGCWRHKGLGLIKEIDLTVSEAFTLSAV